MHKIAIIDAISSNIKQKVISIVYDRKLAHADKRYGDIVQFDG